MSDIYLKNHSDSLSNLENHYDILPRPEIQLRTGMNNYCLAQTMNLAKARQSQKPNIKKLEQILSQSRSIAVKLTYK